MGLWVDTTYVNGVDVDRVAGALTDLVRAEGMRPIDPPAPRERLLVEPMQYEPALGNDLWALALFPGASGWTVIQSAPLALLGERAKGATRMRLAALCSALQVPAFQFHLYDSSASVLVEVGPGGSVFVSGCDPSAMSADPLCWNGEQIAEENVATGFRLLPFGDCFDADTFDEEKATAIAARFGGANARWCDNGVSVDTLIRHTPFEAPGGRVLYFKWPGPSRQRYPPLATWAEYQALPQRAPE